MRSQNVVPLTLVALMAASAGCRKKSEPVVHNTVAQERAGDGTGDGTSEPMPAATGGDGTDEDPSRDPREVAMETAYQSLVVGDEGAAAKVLALGADALPVVEKALDSGNVVATEGAVKLLPKLVTPKGPEYLATALTSASPAVRMAALDVSAEGPHRLDLGKIRAALDDTEVEVRATACDTLGAMGARDDESVRAIFNRLGDDEAVVRTACSSAFAQLADVGTWLPQLAKQLESPRVPLREGTVRALGELHADEGYDFIRGRLADADASVVAAALAALSRYPTEASVREVEPFLRDERRSARIEAAAALSRLPAAAVKNLVYEALKDRDSAVRIEAAAALGRFGDDPETFIRLHALLRDEEAAVRDITSLVLLELHDPRSFRAISARLADETDDGVKARLVDALAATDAQRAVPIFIDRLGGAKGDEATSLLIALRTATGQEFSLDPTEWKAWYAKTHPEGGEAAPEAPPAPAAAPNGEAPAAPPAAAVEPAAAPAPAATP